MSGAGLRPRQPGPSERAPRPGKGQGPRPGRGPGAPKHSPRPQGARGARPAAGVEGLAMASGGASPTQSQGGGGASHAGPSRHPGPRPAKGPRPWKQRAAGGKPADSRGPGGGPGESRKVAKKYGQRPHRARHNFDEVQPQSNANASPFGRSTLTVPGGASRGPGNEGARHRSGPRAHKAAKNGQARSHGASATFADRGDTLPAEYATPRRPVTQTQIRSKRTRTIVQADFAADARLRREPTPSGDDES